MIPFPWNSINSVLRAPGDVFTYVHSTRWTIEISWENVALHTGARACVCSHIVSRALLAKPDRTGNHLLKSSEACVMVILAWAFENVIQGALGQFERC